MFVLTVDSALNAYRKFSSDILDCLSGNAHFTTLPPETYATIRREPFDVTIIEKIDNGVVITCDLDWSDIGTWNSIWQLREKDPKGNALSGRIACVESQDCLIESNSLLIAAIGLQDVAIIEHGDSILVADKKNPKAMRALSTALKEKRHAIYEERPWGIFRILTDNPGYKVKEITIKPGHKQSLHTHHHRCEFITIIKGTARITLHSISNVLGPQEHLFIPILAKHRIENAGDEDLVFVEVQVGEQIEEADIVRFDDCYGRGPTLTKKMKADAYSS
jgi:mannose-1-phosphate guanylyltransferase/mannose-6-phosphate isomerase